METLKTIAVVVPCYMYAKYLPECIESIVNQTYKANEIIIVNDGSPDNTSEIARSLIEKYPTSNIILMEKENGGLSSARNAGIKIAKSYLITCLDADDKLTPAGLEEHLKLIVDDFTIGQAALMEFGERHVVMVPSQTSLPRILRSNTVYCNAMFPKKAWEEVGGYDESEIMRFGYEDWEFWIRCLAKDYQVNTSDFIALRYRVHNNNMTKETTHPNRNKLYDYIFEKHKDLYEKYNVEIAR